MSHGLERLETLPLSLRLLREAHEKLMQGARGSEKAPGEFRRSQNWIGGTRPGNARFVPPPPDRLMECLDSFERFMHDQEQRLPVLVKAALLHHQFETIHPFLDGNGRLGRLLINLFLCVEGVLEQPILYLSLYLKTHRTRYYELLQDVRETGDWEKWIAFFLEGIEQTATQATEAARTIVTLFERNHSAIENKGGATATTLRIHTALQRLQIVTAKRVSEICNISNPTALRNLGVLEEAGIIKETTGRQRNRVFAYSEYLAILSEGTKPLDR